MSQDEINTAITICLYAIFAVGMTGYVAFANIIIKGFKRHDR